MTVRDLMTAKPIAVPPDTPMLDARRLMQEERVRHLLVTRERRLVGIVTDRDIRLNLPSRATSLSVWEMSYLLARLTVGEVMKRDVVVVGPEDDARRAARLLLDHKIGALPVVDGEQVIGIVTEADFVRAFANLAERAAAPR
jgi:acetoin utilization protein AcuB